MQHTERSQGHSSSSPSPPLSLSVSHSHTQTHTEWGQHTHFLSKLYSYFWGLPMTSRQMKRGFSARRRQQSNVPQSNYKRGAGGRTDAVYQLMLLLGVRPPILPSPPPKVNFFKLSACQIGSILPKRRVRRHVRKDAGLSHGGMRQRRALF